MPVEVRVQIQGLEELARGLRGMRRTLQRKTLRKPLFTAMELMRKTVAGNAPVLDRKKRGSAWMLRNKARRTGLVRRSVKTLWSKLQVRRGDAGVWLTVTRAKTTKRQIREGGGSKRLAVNARRRGGFGLIRHDGSAGATYFPNDPFYFKFLEQGTKHIKKERYQFIGRAATGAQGNATMATFTREAITAINALKASDTK